MKQGSRSTGPGRKQRRPDPQFPRLSRIQKLRPRNHRRDRAIKSAPQPGSRHDPEIPPLQEALPPSQMTCYFPTCYCDQEAARCAYPKNTTGDQLARRENKAAKAHPSADSKAPLLLRTVRRWIGRALGKTAVADGSDQRRERRADHV